MNLNDSIRVMLVDDHPAFRKGMAALIESEPDLEVVVEAGDGAQAIDFFRQHRPDVVLMDLRLPGIGGVEAIIAIRREFPDAKILVLTTFDTDEDIYRAIQSGAKSCLLKDASEDELTQTIRSVHLGKQQLPPRVAELLAARERRPNLSQREMDVLHALVKGRSNKEMAAALSITEDTVKAHLKSLYAKLDVKDRTQAAINAVRHGIVHLDGQ